MTGELTFALKERQAFLPNRRKRSSIFNSTAMNAEST
jgi:hypothetical protein